MALLEDKCLMLFRNYIEENYSKYFTWSDWLSGKITDSMKWGVYQEFFDSVGVFMGRETIDSYWLITDERYETEELNYHSIENIDSMLSAIEQANKLVNQM